MHRFVPGETVADALDSVGQLRDSDRLVSIDYLGEDVTDADAANATVDAYLGLLDALDGRDEPAADGPTARGVVEAVGARTGVAARRREDRAGNAHAICERAKRAGAWVTVDAEDHTTTDSTLSIVRDLRTEFHWLGTVLQAYLKRTQSDCEEFAASGARIRLCKGAYDEPASVAFREREDVTDSYLRCLRVLMAGDGYPMVASHDPEIIAAVPEMVRESGRGVDDFEYQMLFGIRDAEQRRLADEGNHVRVYVPFGTEWYGYFVRRLAERPANLKFFLRALAERRHSSYSVEQDESCSWVTTHRPASPRRPW